MQIGQAVYEALVKNDARLFSVVADWIEDHRSSHPEAAVYLKRLRLPRLRTRTVIDVVCKFGSRGERKLFARVERIIMKMRHRPERPVPNVGDLFSLSSRRAINRAMAVRGGRSRKKPLLSKMRKHAVLGSEAWYVGALRSLLEEYY